MGAQFVEIAGQKMAMLPLAEYERLIDIAEDKADVSAAAGAEQRRLAGEEYLPVELVDRLMAGENALKVWRNHRGLTLKQLSEAAGISIGMLSQMECGQRQGKPPLWRALADALNVTIDDLLPA